jgi:flagellar biosynthesis protein FlhG
MANATEKGRVLAVTSGKGGVGKTNITANLAICMAAAGKKVLLIDADLPLGNLDIIMGIESKYNISHVISGRKRIDEVVQIGPEGVEIVCGVSGIEGLADLGEFQRQRLVNELSKLQDSTEIMLIDTAAGLSKNVIAFCMASDDVLVVTTPEATAMTDAYAMIKVLVGNKYAGKINVLVNMARSREEGKRIYQQISTVASRFLNTSVYEAGVLLRDELLTSAVRQRKPVVLAYPKSRITADIGKLAAKLTRTGRVQKTNEGFFRKVMELFF